MSPERYTSVPPEGIPYEKIILDFLEDYEDRMRTATQYAVPSNTTNPLAPGLHFMSRELTGAVTAQVNAALETAGGIQTVETLPGGTQLPVTLRRWLGCTSIQGGEMGLHHWGVHAPLGPTRQSERTLRIIPLALAHIRNNPPKPPHIAPSAADTYIGGYL